MEYFISLARSAYFGCDGERQGYAVENADLLIIEKYQEVEARMAENKQHSEEKQEKEEKKKLILKTLSAFQDVKTAGSKTKVNTKYKLGISSVKDSELI